MGEITMDTIITALPNSLTRGNPRSTAHKHYVSARAYSGSRIHASVKGQKRLHSSLQPPQPSIAKQRKHDHTTAPHHQ